MSWLQTLDDALIDKVANPIAHKIEHATGISNFTLALFVLLIWPATAGAAALNKQTATEWIMCALTVLVSASRYAFLTMLDRRTRRNALGNEDRLWSWWWRKAETILILCCLPFNLLLWRISLADIGMWAVWVHLYFAACDRPPPQQVREPLFARPALGTN